MVGCEYKVICDFILDYPSVPVPFYSHTCFLGGVVCAMERDNAVPIVGSASAKMQAQDMP